MVFVLTLLFFSYSWQNPFIFDDIVKIQENSDLKPGSSITETLLYPYQKNATNLLRNDPSRPLTFLTYRACYQIADGQPWPFHAASSLFHALNAVLIFMLAGLLARRLFNSSSSLPGILAAVGYVVLPMNSGTVLYAYAFSDVLAGFFLLSALYVFCRKPQVSMLSLTGALLLYAGGLLSKQSAIVLPALLLATDLLLNQFTKKRSYAYGGFVVMAFAYLGLRYSFFGGIGDLEGTGNTFAPLVYLKVQGVMILKYLQMSLIPIGFAIDHGINPAEIPTAASLFAWLVVLATAGLSVYVLLRKTVSVRAKIFAWAWVFFLITLTPTSSFLPTVDLFVERRAYLGTAALLIVMGLHLLRPQRPRLRRIAATLLMLLFAGVTFTRMQLYGSPENLWRESVALYPTSQRARVNLGVIYAAQSKFAEAKLLFESILAQFPKDPFVNTKMALIYQDPNYAGHDLQKALDHYKLALETTPNDLVTLYNTGLLLIDAGNYVQARGLFQRTLQINPRFTYGLLGLGITAMREGDKSEAIEQFRRALEIDPQMSGARTFLQELQK